MKDLLKKWKKDSEEARERWDKIEELSHILKSKIEQQDAGEETILCIADTLLTLIELFKPVQTMHSLEKDIEKLMTF